MTTLNNLNGINCSLFIICALAFRVPTLKQHGTSFKYAMTPIFIADYQVDVRLPNMHNVLHLHLLSNVYVNLLFSWFMTFFASILSIK